MFKNNLKMIFDRLSFFKRDMKIFFSKGKLPKDNKQLIVIPTYRCSSTCEYCYARPIQRKIRNDMKIEDFKKLIKWVKPQHMKLILFAGGEPTEHPDFLDFLDLCKKNRISFKILTNNLFNNKFAESLKNYKFRFKNIINYNPQSFYSQTQYRRFLSNLDILKKNQVPFEFYFNIRKKDKFSDYDQLIEDAKNYQADIGLCLTVPHKLDLEDESQKILYLVDQAQKKGVNCKFKRPLPRCIFSDDEWRRLKKCLKKYFTYSVCDLGPLVVNPDLTVFPCNSVFIKGASILSFKNTNHIHSYYSVDLEKLIKLPLDNKCRTCLYFYQHACHGGCLANKMKND